jgi:hypothetical protein
MLPALFLFAVLVAAPALAEAPWIPVESNVGRYVAMFPQTPQRSESTGRSDGAKYGFPAGSVVANRLENMFLKAGDAIFYSAFLRYIGEGMDPGRVLFASEAELRSNRDNFVNGLTDARLVSSTNIVYERGGPKFPGIEFTCQTPTYVFVGRFFVAGNDVFGIIHGRPKGQESIVETQRFLSSLEILPR